MFVPATVPIAKVPFPFVSSHSRRDDRPWSPQIFPFTRMSLSALLQQLRHQSRPPRLVIGADAGSVVPVEVLVEEQVVAEVRVALHLLRLAEGRTVAIRILEEDRGEPSRDLCRDLRER